MKITYVARYLNSTGGGSNLSLDLMARQMVERGHKVTILTANPEVNNPPEDRPYEFHEFEIEHTVPSVTAVRIWRLMNRFQDQTDVFHIFTPVFLSPAGCYRLSGGEKPVITRLNSIYHCTNLGMIGGECYKNCTTADKFTHDRSSLIKRVSALPFYFYRTNLLSKVANSIDRFIALAPGVSSAYEYMGLDGDTIVTIPNFYDGDLGSGSGSSVAVTETDDGVLDVLYVGRLEPDKSVEVLVRSVSHLTEEHIHVHIVGDGSQRADLETLSNELEIEDSITFHGYVPNDQVVNYYEAADVFVHTMIGPYTFSRTLLEAMQHDTPSIVNRVGDSAELASGACFPYDDSPRSLAEVIDRLKRHPSELAEAKENCAGILESFTVDNICDRIENEYRKMASENR